MEKYVIYLLANDYQLIYLQAMADNEINYDKHFKYHIIYDETHSSTRQTKTY